MKIKGQKGNKRIGYYILILFITLFIIIIDQLTKHFAKSINGTITLIPKVLEFVYVENTGIAFGLLKDMGWMMIVVPILIICLIVYYLKDIKDRFLIICLSLILGGAFGNLIDRLMYGSIIDFISVSIWPVFNVADSCVCVGTVLLVVYFIKKKN